MADGDGISLADALSLIGIVGGGALASRGGSIGTPLGVGAAGLGEFGLLYSQNKAEREKQRRLAAMLYNMKDPMGKPDSSMRAAASAMLSGANITDALNIAKSQQTTQQQANLAQQLKGIAPATGPTEPVNIALPQLIEGGMSPAEAKTTYETMTGYTKPEKSPLDVDPEGNVIDVKPGMKLPKGSMTLSEYGKPPPKPDKPEKGPMFVGPDGTIIEGRPGVKIPAGAMPATYFGRPTAASKPVMFATPEGKTFPVTAGTDIPAGSVPLSKFGGTGKANEFEFFKNDYLKRSPDASAEEVVKAFSGAKRPEAKPLIIKTPTEVLVVDPSTYETKRTIPIPEKVRDRKEYSDFAEGYLSDHPKANGAEIATAYNKMKGGNKSPKDWKPPPGLPKEYTPTPSPSLPGAVFLSPKPASGLLAGLTAPTTPLLYIPSTGKYVKPGEEVAPGVIWDGKP